MIFSDRQTCEFRLHDATLNHQKIINWLFMMTAVIRYAEKNVESIIKSNKKIPFIDVLDYYKEAFPKSKEAAFLSAYLKEYYLSRCTQFENDLRKGDKISEYDLKHDKNYVFGYEGVTDLF